MAEMAVQGEQIVADDKVPNYQKHFNITPETRSEATVFTSSDYCRTHFCRPDSWRAFPDEKLVRLFVGRGFCWT